MSFRRATPFTQLSKQGKKKRIDAVLAKKSKLPHEESASETVSSDLPCCDSPVGDRSLCPEGIGFFSEEPSSSDNDIGNVPRSSSEEEDEVFHLADDEGFDCDFHDDSDDSDCESEGCIYSEDPAHAAFKNYENVRSLNIVQLIVHWALLYQVKMNALSALLKILRQFTGFTELPKDARTMLKTPVTENARAVGEGEYYHFGVLKEILPYLKLLPLSITEVKLSVNVDGLPLFKSSESQLWPILVSVSGLQKVFCVGLYQGESKPEDAENFLAEFIQELTDLIQSGIQVSERRFLKVSLFCVVCDAPAKCFLLGSKGHTGYSSCTRCMQKGKHVDHKVVFPDVDASARTHEDSLKKTDSSFHHKASVFETVPGVNMIRTFALDYMHLVCLGVMRTMLKIWIGGKAPFKIPSLAVLQCSEQLFQFRTYIAAEFCRKPRSLDLIKRWKATELRQFLLYTGPIVLKTALDPHKYDNFLVLSVAIRILLSPRLVCHISFIDYARKLLRNFVHGFKNLYGVSYLTHNFHNLIHLPDDAEEFGSLDNVSAFKFENFLQTLKSYVRKPTNVLAQVIRRMGEVKNANVGSQINGSDVLNDEVPWQLSTKHVEFEDVCEPHYSSIYLSGFKISPNFGDSCFGTIDNSIVVAEGISFSPSRNCLVIIGKEFMSKTDFFIRPCKSSLVGIYKVSRLSKLKCWPISDVTVKYQLLPEPSTPNFVVFPIIHTQ